MEEVENYANKIFKLHETQFRKKGDSWTLFHKPIQSFEKLDYVLAPCKQEQPNRIFPDTTFTFGLFRLILTHKVKKRPLDYQWVLTLIEEYANKFYKQNFHRIKIKKMAIHSASGKPIKGWNNVDDNFRGFVIQRRFIDNRFTFYVFKLNLLKRLNHQKKVNYFVI